MEIGSGFQRVFKRSKYKIRRALVPKVGVCEGQIEGFWFRIAGSAKNFWPIGAIIGGVRSFPEIADLRRIPELWFVEETWSNRIVAWSNTGVSAKAASLVLVPPVGVCDEYLARLVCNWGVCERIYRHWFKSGG